MSRLRTLAVALATALVASASACGGDGGGTTGPVIPSPVPAPTVVSITVFGPSSSLVQGTTAQFTKTCVWSDGASRECPMSLIWASSAPTVASVTTGGLVTALAPGVSKISASVGSVTGALDLEVRAPSTFISFEEGVSEESRAMVTAGLTLGFSDFEKRFGWKTTRDVGVRVTTSSAWPVAYARGGLTGDSIVVNTGNDVWVTAPDESRKKMMVHELYHVYQYQTDRLMAPVWLREGTAEFSAYQVAFVETGLLTFEQIRGCHIWNLAFADPKVGPLEAYKDSIGSGPTYSLFYLAFELWMEKGGGSLKEYGAPPETFYAEFEAYRATLVRPEQYECFGFRE